jgi:hypothetical protein
MRKVLANDWELFEENDDLAEHEAAISYSSASAIAERKYHPNSRKPKKLAWSGNNETVIPENEESFGSFDDGESSYATDVKTKQMTKLIHKSKSKSSRVKNADNKRSKPTELGRSKFFHYITSPFFYIRGYMKSLCLAMTDKGQISIDVIIFSAGVFQSFIMDFSGTGKGINTVLILLLGASIKFDRFPERYVRPQVSISLLTGASIAVDVIRMTIYGYTSSYLAGFIFISLFKAALLTSLLYNTTAASRRARKYLVRRLRLFGIFCQQPRRIMRDIRARMLAIGWMELVAAVYYLICSLLSITLFDYSIFFLSQNLSIYLLVKAVSSFILFLGILYDTDVVLCLWYFGCLSCAVSYVRKYINIKRIEFGGWPLAFSFYLLRFQIFLFFKSIDVLIGIYGWIILAPYFGPDFLNVETKLKIFVSFVVFAQLSTDVWVPLLLYVVQWLLRRKKVLKALALLEVSDDSEIDEFELRTDLEKARLHYAKAKRRITVGYDPAAAEDEEKSGKGTELRSAVRAKKSPTKVATASSSLPGQRRKRKVHPEVKIFDPLEDDRDEEDDEEMDTLLEYQKIFKYHPDDVIEFRMDDVGANHLSSETTFSPLRKHSDSAIRI